MVSELFRILCIANRLEKTPWLRKRWIARRQVRYVFTRVERTEEALHQLAVGRYDAILLIHIGKFEWDRFESFRIDAPDVPVVVLSDQDDETQAIRVIQLGAQDYLVQQHTDSKTCARSLRYAIERQRWREELRAMSLKDELTGLYNRRGFFLLADQHLRLARRMGSRVSLVFADLDGLKKINDQFGHSEGDRALHQVAIILKACFRNSDLMARIGGDEFAVLAIHTDTHKHTDIIARLEKKLRAFNARACCGYDLALSLGIVHHDPDHPRTLREMLERADTLMYNQKRKKRDA